MKSKSIIILFLGLLGWSLNVEAQRLNWTKVGRPHAAKLIAVDGITQKLYAMNTDGSLYSNDQSGRDSAWRRVGRLPRNIRNFSVVNGQVYYLDYYRYLYKGYPQTPGSFRRLGNKLHSADQFDISAGTGLLRDAVALNKDKTLWLKKYHNQNPSMYRWNKVGKPWAADQIIKTDKAMFALNFDKSFYINDENGKDSAWKKIGKPHAAANIAASANIRKGVYEIYALNRDKTLWKVEYKIKKKPAKTYVKTRALQVMLDTGNDDVNRSKITMKVLTDDNQWHEATLAQNEVIRARFSKKRYLYYKNNRVYAAHQVKKIVVNYESAQTDIFGAKDQSDLKFRVSTFGTDHLKNEDVVSTGYTRYTQYNNRKMILDK